MANKFNLDDLIDDCSSSEDSSDSERDTPVGRAFDKEGDKRCHVFNYSSPESPEDVLSTSQHSSERESQFLKKRRMDKLRHSKTSDAGCERTTPTRLPTKRVRRNIKSSTLSKKSQSPSTSASPDGHISSSPDTPSSIDVPPPTDGTANLDNMLPSEIRENEDNDQVPPNDIGTTNSNMEVFKMLKNITNVLNTLVERVETTESEIKLVKDRLTSSSNSSDGGVKKVEVPLVVRVRNHSCSLILLLITELLCLIFSLKLEKYIKR